MARWVIAMGVDSGDIELGHPVAQDLAVRAGDDAEHAAHLADLTCAPGDVRFEQMVEHEAIEPIEVARDLAALLMIERREQLGDHGLRAAERVREARDVAAREPLLGLRQEALAAIEHHEQELPA